MRIRNLFESIRTFAAAGSLMCVVCGTAVAQQTWPVAPPLVLEDGSELTVGGAVWGTPPFNGYRFAAVLFDAAGKLRWDTRVRIWGYHERVSVAVVQPDGRIVLGGNAIEPIPNGDPPRSRTYPAVIRLNADGSVDRTFNGSGKIVFTLGEPYEAYLCDDWEGEGLCWYQLADRTLANLELDPDGRIIVISEGGARARLNADGSLDTSFIAAGAPVAQEVRFVEYQGLWWNDPSGSEAGWGLSIAHQGDTIVAAWFTYSDDGAPRWFIIVAAKAGANTYAGTVYTATGPPYSSAPFDPSKVVESVVGSATLSFADDSHASFAYTVYGRSQTKSITRQSFGLEPACNVGTPDDLLRTLNYQDLWWAAPAGSEPGWGVNLAHQGSTLFVTWFTYDATGAPTWFSALAPVTKQGTYTGTLERTTGPPFSASPFLPENVVATDAGTVTLSFASGNEGTFDYTVGGVTGTRTITRQIFDGNGTVCRRTPYAPLMEDLRPQPEAVKAM